ncbi:GOLPH3/VPS74 family protein [Actinospica robiniae]|uniref:GOLPH3/VPS74 family protein n=1 Tax=Actinospica robiniae TaxID=304901 RepID=UPI00040322E6|nr:GPP34 family phosphoprotein [Actinospica robiniae]
MPNLGEEIVLVALRPDGRVSGATTLHFALAGAELVSLVIAERVGIRDERIVILDPAPTGDVLLDAALADIAKVTGGGRPPKPKTWVARSRSHPVTTYLRQLAKLGIVREQRSKALGVFTSTRWITVDPTPVAAARARLDGIALSQEPVAAVEAAFGALVHVIGLDKVLYPGREGSPARARLNLIAKGDPASRAVGEAMEGVQAGVDAAVEAAVDAAIHASVAAAHHAATAHHAGGAGGGHH